VHPGPGGGRNNVLVEHVVEHRPWRTQLDQLLAGYDVFWVGVFCDLDEIDRREAIRGDRTRGEGRAHVERDRIHDHGPYHLHVDTTAGVTDTTAHTVINAWTSRRRSNSSHLGPRGLTR
jgi:chloramphenicol 3-O phosphotransferase